VIVLLGLGRNKVPLLSVNQPISTLSGQYPRVPGMAKGIKMWCNRFIMLKSSDQPGASFLSCLQDYSYLKGSHGKSQLVHGTSSGLHLHLLPGAAHYTSRTRPENREKRKVPLWEREEIQEVPWQVVSAEPQMLALGQFP
jgi:hypothetical protein